MKPIFTEEQAIMLTEFETIFEPLLARILKHHDTAYQNQRSNDKARAARSELTGSVRTVLDLFAFGSGHTEAQVQQLVEVIIQAYREFHQKVLIPVPVVPVVRVRGLAEYEEISEPTLHQTTDPLVAIEASAKWDYRFMGGRITLRETLRGHEVGITDPLSLDPLWTGNYYRVQA